VNPVEIFQFVETTLGTKVSSVRINRGSLIFALDTRTSAEEARQVIAGHIGPLSSVKLLDPSVINPPTQDTMVTGAPEVSVPSATTPMYPPAPPMPSQEQPAVPMGPPANGPELQPPSTVPEGAAPSEYHEPEMPQHN